MREDIPPLPNTPSWRGAQLKIAQGLYLIFTLSKSGPNTSCRPYCDTYFNNTVFSYVKKFARKTFKCRFTTPNFVRSSLISRDER
jgi:hypothetical protein